MKSDTFSLNNCFKDGTVFTNSQLTGSDAFCGLAKGCTLPITKTFDGKDIKVTVSKEIKSLKIQCEGSYTPSTGKWTNFIFCFISPSEIFKVFLQICYSVE